MRKNILLALIIWMPFYTKAQITLTAQLPGNGVVLKDQLWNCVLINNGADMARVKLQLDVKDILLGQSVMNANTGSLLIGKGMKLITIKDLQILYNYIATEFSGNYLPCGSYTVNYHLLQETIHGDLPVSDEVLRLNVTPLSPPLLTTPIDNSSSETGYPEFTWMPPTPSEMFNPLSYDIKVVNVEDGQSLKEAMEFNRPVYFNSNLQRPEEKIATSFEKLQNGRTYAWQVIAHSGMSYSLPTEIWKFSLGKDSITKIIDQAPFIKISKTNTEVTVAHNGVIKLEYLNVCGDKKLTFHIYNSNVKGRTKKQALQFELPVTAGRNLFQYNTLDRVKFDQKEVYELSVVNGRGEEWLMKFVPVYYQK